MNKYLFNKYGTVPADAAVADRIKDAAKVGSLSCMDVGCRAHRNGYMEYQAYLHGGDNGNGRWSLYMTDLAIVLSHFESMDYARIEVADIEVDRPDDVFYCRVRLIKTYGNTDENTDDDEDLSGINIPAMTHWLEQRGFKQLESAKDCNGRRFVVYERVDLTGHYDGDSDRWIRTRVSMCSGEEIAVHVNANGRTYTARCIYLREALEDAITAAQCASAATALRLADIENDILS